MRNIFSIILILVVFSTGKSFAQGCEAPSGDDDALKLFGFFQPQYDYTMQGDDASNTFKFKRARIGLTGNIPYDFSYYVVLENSAFVSKTGNPYLLDAFVSYNRYKWFTVSVGSFKQPFGQEVNTSCSGLNTIERAMVSDQIVAPQRDMGIMFLGGDNSTLLKYSFAIMNGTGLGITDNNSKKDFIGRLTIKPLDFLRFGGSFRSGFPTNDVDDRMSFAGELQLSYYNWLLEGEYIYDEGDYNKAAGGGCGAEPLALGTKRSGAYIQALYMTPWMVQPVIKWEMFYPSMDVDGDMFNILTAGINYFFNDWTRLQCNYRYVMDEKAVDSHEIKLQLQVKF